MALFLADVPAHPEHLSTSLHMTHLDTVVVNVSWTPPPQDNTRPRSHYIIKLSSTERGFINQVRLTAWTFWQLWSGGMHVRMCLIRKLGTPFIPSICSLHTVVWHSSEHRDNPCLGPQFPVWRTW